MDAQLRALVYLPVRYGFEGRPLVGRGQIQHGEYLDVLAFPVYYKEVRGVGCNGSRALKLPVAGAGAAEPARVGARRVEYLYVVAFEICHKQVPEGIEYGSRVQKLPVAGAGAAEPARVGARRVEYLDVVVVRIQRKHVCIVGGDADQTRELPVSWAKGAYCRRMVARCVKHLNTVGISRGCKYARRRDCHIGWHKTASRVERGRVRARGVEYVDLFIVPVSYEHVRAVVRESLRGAELAGACADGAVADLVRKRAVVMKHLDVVAVVLCYKQVGGVGRNALGFGELSVAGALTAELARVVRGEIDAGAGQQECLDVPANVIKYKEVGRVGRGRDRVLKLPVAGAGAAEPARVGARKVEHLDVVAA